MTEEKAQAQALQPGQEVSGTITRLELYGAFVDIGAERDALLHISQFGNPDVRNVEDAFKSGDEFSGFVLKIHETGRIALTTEKPPEVSWDTLKVDGIYKGKVVRIENFGIFVDIGAERPGMVHVSELASGFVKSPSDVVSMDDEVEVRVIKLNRRKRQIDLSMKLDEPVAQVVEVAEDDIEIPTAMAFALQKAMAGEDGGNQRDSKGSKGNKRRNEQEDIMKRTLRQHLPN